ncbi:Anucleate primary sterigmata protein B [Curvularia kusanoi]|uniref:Anucleate primary sterigmata protein B n=1 Tax=Curvularia kusanoi TaxID=90978 RepID=A0A9P4TFL6_CURKU|nr:Anucleate primary sterigmata protein B [Curvularia kusanoi]
MTSSPAPASAEAPQTNNSATTSAATESETPHRSMERSISHLEDVQAFDVADADLPPLPDASDDDSFLRQDFQDDLIPSDGSDIMDRKMKRQLMDIESSFLPDMSALPGGSQTRKGADDTYLFGGSPGTVRPATQDADDEAGTKEEEEEEDRRSAESSMLSEGHPTPAGAYKTPAARRLDADTTEDSLDHEHSMSETAPSSPSAEAAQRRSKGHGDKREPHGAADLQQKELDPSQRPVSSASTVKAPDFSRFEEAASLNHTSEASLDSIAMPPPPRITTTSPRTSKRPSFLQNRQSSQRSSISSITNHSDVSGDAASTESLGADYALQTGGAVPRPNLPHRSSMGLSRLPSLGSVASSVSGFSDTNTWEKHRSVSTNSISGLLQADNGLGRLDEEANNATTPPETPRTSGVGASTNLTDTVVARHVQDIQVPDTVAREFRAKHGQSPEKRYPATPFTRSKHNLTLKEQNSKIDKLSKENFDLKLKIHFLDQALQNRSDEGVKEMISKNVQLQTDLATEKKETQTLRKKVRELERKLKSQEEGQSATKDSGSGSEDEENEPSSRYADLEEEILFLRERLESAETITEQWQQEALQKEADNRRMADYIKIMREKSPSGESGFDEAVNIWKEDLQEERVRREEVEARCEHAESERDRLREELQRTREQNRQILQHASNHGSRVHNSSRLAHQSYADRSDAGSEPHRPTSGGSSTLVDQLQTSNERLQRDLHAQTSMLTSRNRENTRLREENEGLRLTLRRGDVGSIAGDSILERSISRNHMRSVSRASGGTRVTQMSDSEREDLETKLASARDELSQLKLLNKELDDQLVGHLDMLETAENKIKECETELEAQSEDIQALAAERNEALELLQDKEQECEELRVEAIDTVQRLETELEQMQQERDRIATDLEHSIEDFNALQQEMKNVSESLVQLEDDQNASLRKIENLESELRDAMEELDRQDKMLGEERSKNEKLDIQLESCQGEVDFLREEQEGDKIKIGELESDLENAQINMQHEKERLRDLEERFAEERQQRDALESHGKQEVEKVMSDLNAQLAKLKEESRKLRKDLSSKEVEANNWRRQHDEFESSLRDALGNTNGTKPGLLKDITRLQRDLDSTLDELNFTRNDLHEKEQLLRNRDTLLESTGLQVRQSTEALERERQLRRQEAISFENAKRGHQSVTRTIQLHETRVTELETLRSQDRSKLHNLEKQYKEQLLERNNLLYALWNRLSTLCGAEWCRNHALVNGELTSMELISRNIKGFNHNIVLAVKTVEGIIGGFKQRIRNTEKDLIRDYQTLEHTLDGRIKRLDLLEKQVLAQRQSIGRPSTVRGGVVELNSQELTKLRNENKNLRTEVQTLRAITSTAQAQSHSQPQSGNDLVVSKNPARTGSPAPSKRASVAHTLLRAHSTSVVEHLQQQQQTSSGARSPGHPYPEAGPLQSSEQKWIHRLKELERRLKAEREARLLDRSGARKRLEQKVEENADLKAMLERERERLAAEGYNLNRSLSHDGPARSRERSDRGSVMSRQTTLDKQHERDEDDY